MAVQSLQNRSPSTTVAQSSATDVARALPPEPDRSEATRTQATPSSSSASRRRANAVEQFGRQLREGVGALASRAEAVFSGLFPEATKEYRAAVAHSWPALEKLGGVVAEHRDSPKSIWAEYRSVLVGDSSRGVENVTGWLTTSALAPPRLGNHPLDKLTRQPDAQGRSSEERLRTAIMNASRSGQKLDAGDVLTLSMGVAGDDYFLGLVTAHNLMKNLTHSERVPSAVSPTQARADAAVRARLQNLRPPSDPSTDKMGPWYHTYAVGIVDALGTPLMGQLGARLENLDFTFAHDRTEAALNVLSGAAFGGGTLTAGVNALFASGAGR